MVLLPLPGLVVFVGWPLVILGQAALTGLIAGGAVRVGVGVGFLLFVRGIIKLQPLSGFFPSLLISLTFPLEIWEGRSESLRAKRMVSCSPKCGRQDLGGGSNPL